MPEELVPIFHVADATSTGQWYARLGFKVVREHRFAPELPLYVILERDGVHLHLSEHAGDAPPQSLAYLYVEDVESLATEFGIEITEQPWAREIQLTDPDGNRLSIGQTTGG